MKEKTARHLALLIFGCIALVIMLFVSLMIIDQIEYLRIRQNDLGGIVFFIVLFAAIGVLILLATRFRAVMYILTLLSLIPIAIFGQYIVIDLLSTIMILTPCLPFLFYNLYCIVMAIKRPKITPSTHAETDSGLKR